MQKHSIEHGALMHRDTARLRSLEGRIRQRRRRGAPCNRLEAQHEELLAAATACARQRAALVPPLGYPQELPVVQYKEQIVAAIRDHSVVIVAGETGSGKTTQLPKMCLEAGLGLRGMIGCTQPRRIAAVTVAVRVGDELGCGAPAVAHQVRFDNASSATTLIKFMTDGILLAEIPSDRSLLAYDALIIDEAHERSLNIDFLIGYVKGLVVRRPDLRVIVSSATLDVERFSEHFDGAPVIEVPGRTYPVDVRYQEPESDDADLPHEVARAVRSLMADEPRGDMLVFLAGEQDIREVEKVLRRRVRNGDAEIIPLLARLPVAQQRRAFQVGGQRRIVLATNVAETSLTIPGIRYVIDSGVARLNRYNPKTQVQRLHVEAISQASARQRQGRCGRLGPGICVRLCAAEEFERREAFTPPEIRRVSLASVILRMMDLGLGAIETFPFLDPPSPSMVKDGYRELEELGALDASGKATALGRRLVRLPVEPRLGRMLLAAGSKGPLDEVLTLVAALSVDDVRLRPMDRRDQADALHKRFLTETSDFAGLLRVWAFWREGCRQHHSRTGQRRFCHENMLSYRRMREWVGVRAQLQSACKDQGLEGAGRAAQEEDILKCLLTGLLNKIGMRTEEGDYRGARGVRFWIHPGSGLARKRPDWVVAGELVDTSRLFARHVARIEVGWLETLAGPLCRSSYGEPYWDAEHGFVRAEETVLLYGLPIVRGRRRDYGGVDRAGARCMFITHALVRGELEHVPGGVLRDNARLIAELRELEERTRRSDLVVDESAIEAFYDRALDPDVWNLPSLKRWLSTASRDALGALRLSRAELLRRDLDVAVDEAFPTHVTVGDTELMLRYRHRRGESSDGVTCVVPVTDMEAISAWHHDWGVPGHLVEKVEFLLRSLPKRIRRPLVPVPEAAKAFLASSPDRGKSLLDELARYVRYRTGERVTSDMWPSRLPEHLAVRFEVLDGGGREIASGRDWAVVEREARNRCVHGPTRRAGPGRKRSTSPTWSRDELTTWDVGLLPARVDVGQAGMPVYHYPALTDQHDSAGLRLFTDEEEAARVHRRGVHRLALLALARPLKQLSGLPTMSGNVAAACVVFGLDPRTVLQELVEAAVLSLSQYGEPTIRDGEQFGARIKAAGPQLFSLARELVEALKLALPAAVAIRRRVEEMVQPAFQDVARDMQDQLACLFRPGVLQTTPACWIKRYPAYIQALEVRVDKVGLGLDRDRARLAQLLPFIDRLQQGDPLPLSIREEALTYYRWLIEEWRISLFAQSIGTAVKVSPKRLDKAWADVLITDA